MDAFYQNNYAFVDVCEILLRYYKTVSERFRPTDRMVAHTGYLAFARPMQTTSRLKDQPRARQAEPEEPGAQDQADAQAGLESD